MICQGGACSFREQQQRLHHINWAASGARLLRRGHTHKCSTSPKQSGSKPIVKPMPTLARCGQPALLRLDGPATDHSLDCAGASLCCVQHPAVQATTRLGRARASEGTQHSSRGPSNSLGEASASSGQVLRDAQHHDVQIAARQGQTGGLGAKQHSAGVGPDQAHNAGHCVDCQGDCCKLLLQAAEGGTQGAPRQLQQRLLCALPPSEMLVLAALLSRQCGAKGLLNISSR